MRKYTPYWHGARFVYSRAPSKYQTEVTRVWVGVVDLVLLLREEVREKGKADW